MKIRHIGVVVWWVVVGAAATPSLEGLPMGQDDTVCGAPLKGLSIDRDNTACGAMTWYDIGWQVRTDQEFRYVIKLNWTQQYRTSQEELLMSEHSSTTEIKATLRFRVKEIDEKEGDIALRVEFEKLEGNRNGVALSLDAVDRMTDLETLMSLLFNKIGLILPWDPAEIGSRWVRTVPMMDPLGESIGQDHRRHVGSTADIVISRKGCLVQDQPPGGAPPPPMNPEGSKKFEVKWKGNEIWKGIPVAVMVSEVESPPSEIERHGQSMTLSSKGISEVRFSWPQGQPVSARYEELGRIRYPGAISEVSAHIEVELDGPPPLTSVKNPVFPRESLYPRESKRISQLKEELGEAGTSEDFERIVKGFEEWRLLNRAGPVGVSMISSVIGDQVWWKLTEPHIPPEVLRSALERDYQGSLDLLREAKKAEQPDRLAGIVEEWPMGQEREGARRLLRLAKLDDGDFQRAKWYLSPSLVGGTADGAWLKKEEGMKEGSLTEGFMVPLWALRWPKPFEEGEELPVVVRLRDGMACMGSKIVHLIDEGLGLLRFRGEVAGPSGATQGIALRVNRAGELIRYESVSEGWREQTWRPVFAPRTEEIPTGLPLTYDAISPLHALGGSIEDRGVYFLSARSGAAQQLVLDGWDVDRRASRFEGQWLWGVKLGDRHIQQSLEVKTVLEEPWLAGLATDGTAFLVQAFTGKFQWLKKFPPDELDGLWGKSPRLLLHPDGLALVLAGLGLVEMLDILSGESRWRAEGFSNVIEACLVGDEVWVATPDELVAVRIKDGKRRTLYQFEKPCRGMTAWKGLMIAVEGDQAIVVDSSSGQRVRLEPCVGKGTCRLTVKEGRLYAIFRDQLHAFSMR